MKFALLGPEMEENLGLRYLHAHAVAAGHEGRIFPFREPSEIPRLVESIISYAPQCVGLSMVFTSRAREFTLLAELLRSRGYNGLIIAGGHFASFHSKELLTDAPAIDCIVHGEGEPVFTRILSTGGRFPEISGLSYRNDAGAPCTTGTVPLDDTLDLLPYPTRPATFQNYLGLPIANILGSRGCYANCNFCSIVAWIKQNGGKRLRQRSVSSIAAEMTSLYHGNGIRIFNFHDDNFFLPREADNLRRFAALERELLASGMDRYAIQVKARTDSVTPAVVAALKRIGLFRVFLGVENSSPQGLISLGKGTTVGENGAALGLLKREGIHTAYNLLIFGPDTTIDEVTENVEAIRNAGGVPINFGRTEVYGGTPLERKLRAEGRLKGDYFSYFYDIADAHVQRLFTMFMTVFTERNFALDGLNHRAMRLDYTWHLLKHFYPKRAGDGLGRKVKRAIADLNRSSGTLLGRIAEVSEDPDTARLSRFAAGLRDERREHDTRIGSRIDQLLREIEQRAARRESPWFITEAAAALSAAVLLVTVTECVNPVDPDTTGGTETDMRGTFGDAEFAHIKERIETAYRGEIDSIAQRTNSLDAVIYMNLSISASGSVIGCEILRPTTAENRQCAEAVKGLVTTWTFPAVNHDGHCSVLFSTSRYVEINEGRDWHYAEMIAYPAANTFVPAFDAQTTAMVRDTVLSSYNFGLVWMVEELGLQTLTCTLRLTIDASGWVSAFTVVNPTEESMPQLREAITGVIAGWRFTTVSATGWCEFTITVSAAGYHSAEMIPFSLTDTAELDTNDKVIVYNRIMDTYRPVIDLLGLRYSPFRPYPRDSTGTIRSVPMPYEPVITEWGMTVLRDGSVAQVCILLPSEPATIQYRKELEAYIRTMTFPGLSRGGWCRFNMLAGGPGPEPRICTK